MSAQSKHRIDRYWNERAGYLNISLVNQKLKKEIKNKNTDLLKNNWGVALSYGRSFYLPLNLSNLPYLEANGMDKGEVYDMMKAYASAKVVGDKLMAGEVQPDSIIQSVHPYFQQVLKVS